ncbi:monovalent cation/H+ antiporter complex subunit F [uncultured Phascolarctobacterium sp.]|uniref:monovalent cation/H+ antiporter complex subunit F n=1 Tax=uncultured Phascolarctobacterium sp. TaxID=512296 RepID=UPI0027D9A062|nr:monovalent cation/H+ antiporter complex subunit F [uncultured Phascolarctobacterium sp.]
MHYMIIAIIVVVIGVIGIMLQRVFQGPTVYDRMNGLGVTGTATILLIILFGYLDGRPEMYVDIALAYAILGFVGSVIIAKYLGGKDV